MGEDEEKIVQVSVSGTWERPIYAGVTNTGRVVTSTGDGIWADISPKAYAGGGEPDE